MDHKFNIGQRVSVELPQPCACEVIGINLRRFGVFYSLRVVDSPVEVHGVDEKHLRADA